MDLLGLEENKDFWDMGLDDMGEEVVPIKDLTKCSTIGICLPAMPFHTHMFTTRDGFKKRHSRQIKTVCFVTRYSRPEAAWSA